MEMLQGPAGRSARSPIVRALRFAADEIQLGAALEAVCQEPAVARAFCRAVVAATKYGNPAARRRIKRDAGVVACVGEHRLEARVSRRMAKSRSAGRVDLQFRGHGDWLLDVELKIDSSFGPRQLERYAKTGPTAAIVRSVSQIKNLETLRASQNWVGATTWQSLLPDLRSLPIDDRWAGDWQALLDVMEDDGDFLEQKPRPPEIDAQAELLRALAPAALERLQASMRAIYGDAVDALGLRHGNVGRGGAWASFGIFGADGPWLWIGVRNLWTRTPRLWIDYYPFLDWRAQRRLREAHARIERAKFRPRGGSYRFEEPVPALEGASARDHQRALDAISVFLEKLVRSRVFDVEVDRLAPRR